MAARRRLRGCRLLLASLILLLLLFPVIEEMARPLLLIAVVAAVFVAGVIVVDGGPGHVRTAAILAGIQIAFTVVAVVLSEPSVAYLLTVGFGLAATTLLIVHCIYCVLRYVLQANYIGHDQIYAGICVYLMLGFAFGCIYYLLSILNPNAFAVHNPSLARDRSPDLMYFSFVTLATLGYGDITPVSESSRALAELEALAGMVYIAVFMARLVSMYSAEDSAREIPASNQARESPAHQADARNSSAPYQDQRL